MNGSSDDALMNIGKQLVEGYEDKIFFTGYDETLICQTSLFMNAVPDEEAVKNIQERCDYFLEFIKNKMSVVADAEQAATKPDPKKTSALPVEQPSDVVKQNENIQRPSAVNAPEPPVITEEDTPDKNILQLLFADDVEESDEGTTAKVTIQNVLIQCRYHDGKLYIRSKIKTDLPNAIRKSIASEYSYRYKLTNYGIMLSASSTCCLCVCNNKRFIYVSFIRCFFTCHTHISFQIFSP